MFIFMSYLFFYFYFLKLAYLTLVYQRNWVRSTDWTHWTLISLYFDCAFFQKKIKILFLIMNRDFGLDNLHNLSLGIIKYLLRFSFQRLSDTQKGGLFVAIQNFSFPGFLQKQSAKDIIQSVFDWKLFYQIYWLTYSLLLFILGTMVPYKAIRYKRWYNILYLFWILSTHQATWLTNGRNLLWYVFVLLCSFKL
jgi:hypothetical protein